MASLDGFTVTDSRSISLHSRAPGCLCCYDNCILCMLFLSRIKWAKNRVFPRCLPIRHRNAYGQTHSIFFLRIDLSACRVLWYSKATKHLAASVRDTERGKNPRVGHCAGASAAKSDTWRCFDVFCRNWKAYINLIRTVLLRLCGAGCALIGCRVLLDGHPVFLYREPVRHSVSFRDRRPAHINERRSFLCPFPNFARSPCCACSGAPGPSTLPRP